MSHRQSTPTPVLCRRAAQTGDFSESRHVQGSTSGSWWSLSPAALIQEQVMLDRMTKAMRKAATQPPHRVIAQSATTRSAAGHAVATARHAVMMLGLIAIAIVTTIFFKPEMADKLQALSPFSEAVASTAPDAELAMPPLADLMGEAVAAAQKEAAAESLVAASAPAAVAPGPMIGSDLQQKRVTEWISKRYRVANDATNMLVSAA